MLADEEEDRRWCSVELRARRYLNNVVEQDHRALKQRCVSMLGLKSFRSAATTFAGIELAWRYFYPSKPNGKRRYFLEVAKSSIRASWALMERSD